MLYCTAMFPSRSANLKTTPRGIDERFTLADYSRCPYMRVMLLEVHMSVEQILLNTSEEVVAHSRMVDF